MEQPPERLIFDRVESTGILNVEALSDGQAFTVGVLNVADGPPDSALLRVEASGTALATLTKPLAGWLRENVERIGNAHQNDGEKIAALFAQGPIRLDSRYVLA
jgi:hypothetical protein